MRPGFSTMELMVVVTIILFLIALVLGLGGFRDVAKFQITRTMLSNAALLNEEFHTLSGKAVVGQTIKEFTDATVGLKHMDDLYDGIRSEDKLWQDPSDSRWVLLDAWGNWIQYVHPDYAVSTYGNLPQRKPPYFASSGPDGLFGDQTAPVGSTLYIQSEDNLYSFDVVDK